MTDNQGIKVKHDDSLEWQFILDYAEFGLRINFEAISVLYEKASAIEVSVLRKTICLSGLQLLFSSWEDFALLLQACRKKKDEAVPIYRFLWREGQGRGSSGVPNIFKEYKSARKMLDELGFTSITHKSLTKYYVDISKGQSKAAFHKFLDPQISLYRRSMSKSQFESIYRSFANDVKLIGKLQEKYNELKNRLKHGKGIIEGVVGSDDSNHIAYLKRIPNNDDELQLHWADVSLNRLRDAVIQITQLHRRSLELLWLYMIQHYPDHVEEYRKIYVEQAKSCEKKVKSLGIKSKYMATAAESNNSFNPTPR